MIMRVHFGGFRTPLYDRLLWLMSASVNPEVVSLDCILPLHSSTSFGLARTLSSLIMLVVAFLLGMPLVLAVR